MHVPEAMHVKQVLDVSEVKQSRQAQAIHLKQCLYVLRVRVHHSYKVR